MVTCNRWNSMRLASLPLCLPERIRVIERFNSRFLRDHQVVKYSILYTVWYNLLGRRRIAQHGASRRIIDSVHTLRELHITGGAQSSAFVERSAFTQLWILRISVSVYVHTSDVRFVPFRVNLAQFGSNSDILLFTISVTTSHSRDGRSGSKVGAKCTEI